jgi:hypothetical protein
MPGDPEIVYCMDTSALIDLYRLYPRETFPTLWQKLEDLVQSGRLISTIRVFHEVKSDDIRRWVIKHKKMFIRENKKQLETVKTILASHPTLVDVRKETEDADPFLVALALTLKRMGPQTLFEKKDWAVITQEKPSRGAKDKIPDVCKHYGIECKSVVEFFQTEKWKF